MAATKLAGALAAFAILSDAERAAFLTTTGLRPPRGAVAESHTLAELRASGAFACGITGHGKADDGKFATRGGAEFHAQTCTAMATALKA